MSEKYIITLECNKSALAELIATGLERHATITKVEVAEKKASIKLAAVAGSKPVNKPVNEPALEGAFRGDPKVPLWRKQVTCWEVYKVAIDSFHPQNTFMSADLTSECRRNGIRMSNNSAASHLYRLRKVGLVKKIGGSGNAGYIHVVAKNVGHQEFERIMTNGR